MNNVWEILSECITDMKKANYQKTPFALYAKGVFLFYEGFYMFARAVVRCLITVGQRRQSHPRHLTW